MRNLLLILGDQLSLDNPALAGIDTEHDHVVMIEAAGEATYVWSHKARIVLFLSAMRHFAALLSERKLPLTYLSLTAADGGIDARLRALIAERRPDRVVVCEPGEHRIRVLLESVCREAGVPLEIRPDTHFLCSREQFSAWAKGRRTLRMEHFYRDMRRRNDVLMADGEPESGRWNFDAENRGAFPKGGPESVPQPLRFAPDPITREVMSLVESRFADHPGSLADFGWPVTRAEALRALDDFVDNRLSGFGAWQDAMWSDMPFGWHSLLSAALNLKLLAPREVIAAACAAWREKRAPLAAVEGFVRQILGWREYIRGVYWLGMPAMLASNHFGHHRALPLWFWTGETDMSCLRAAISQTLHHGYAHHIQRLMITGNFALLAGLDPKAVHEWYLAVYVDAVEWAELPNTMGMALHAHGDRYTSKPYVASGAYIKRMSNYCSKCRYRPAEKTGARACPFTVLYWNFLDRHEPELAANPRTALMTRNIRRMGAGERAAIRAEADRLLATIA